MLFRKYYFIFLFALGITTSLLAGWNITGNGKNAIAFYNSSDTIYHLNNFNPSSIETFKLYYNGLEDEQKLDELLRTQNYIEVLNHIWTEDNIEKRINWLERKLDAGHPILIFELGRSYYLKSPTFETYAFQSFPLFYSGIFRVALDCICTSDQSVGAALEFLEMAYTYSVVGELKEKHPDFDLESYIEKNFIPFFKGLVERQKQAIQAFVDGNIESMPSPEWVFYHGLGLNEEESPRREDWNELRRNSASELFHELMRIENLIEEDPKQFLMEFGETQAPAL